MVITVRLGYCSCTSGISVYVNTRQMVYKCTKVVVRPLTSNNTSNFEGWIMRMEDSDMLNVACYVELQMQCSEHVKFEYARIILVQDNLHSY